MVLRTIHLCRHHTQDSILAKLNEHSHSKTSDDEFETTLGIPCRRDIEQNALGPGDSSYYSQLFGISPRSAPAIPKLRSGASHLLRVGHRASEEDVVSQAARKSYDVFVLSERFERVSTNASELR